MSSKVANISSGKSISTILIRYANILAKWFIPCQFPFITSCLQVQKSDRHLCIKPTLSLVILASIDHLKSLKSSKIILKTAIIATSVNQLQPQVFDSTIQTSTRFPVLIQSAHFQPNYPESSFIQQSLQPQDTIFSLTAIMAAQT